MEDIVKITANFDSNEFSCPCCGKNKIQKSIVHQLQLARDLADVPFRITSGYRCVKYNATIPGASETSEHINGVAADIAVANGRERWLILNAVLNAGFQRIGIYSEHIHVDIGLNKPQQVIWHSKR